MDSGTHVTDAAIDLRGVPKKQGNVDKNMVLYVVLLRCIDHKKENVAQQISRIYVRGFLIATAV